ncbi:unnamed protein product [Prunus armeniaca]
MAKGKGKAMTVTIYMNSNSPCKRFVVFPPIVMTTTIHIRYEEMNLYRVLIKPKQQLRLFLPLGQPRLVEPTNSPGSICSLETLFGPRPPLPRQRVGPPCPDKG